MLCVVYFSALRRISRRLYLGGFSVILQSSCIVPISFLYCLCRGGVKEKYSKDEKLKTKDEMQEAKKKDEAKLLASSFVCWILYLKIGFFDAGEFVFPKGYCFVFGFASFRNVQHSVSTCYFTREGVSEYFWRLWCSYAQAY